jgi:hypothetical protein
VRRILIRINMRIISSLAFSLLMSSAALAQSQDTRPVPGSLNAANYGAVADTQRRICTVSITSGQASLTATGCTFRNRDVGKNIVVPYAGATLSTGKINSIPVSSPGSAYTTIPTVAIAVTTGPVGTFGVITGGSLYVNGFYENVPITGGSGTGLTASIAVSGGAVTAIAIDTPGNGYSASDTGLSADSANLGGAGSGFSVPIATLQNGVGFLPQVNMAVGPTLPSIGAGGSGYGTAATGTLTWSGTGCTTSPVINVTSASGAVSTINSITTPGVCQVLPTNAATTWTPGGGLSAGTGAKLTMTFSIDSITPLLAGANYPTAITAAPSAGNATLGAPVVTPVASPLTTTILSVTDATDVTLNANALNTVTAHTEALTWGTDSTAALNAGILAATNANKPLFISGDAGYYEAGTGCCFYGVTSPLLLNPNVTDGYQSNIVGNGPYSTVIVALAPMVGAAGVLYEAPKNIYGGIIRDIALDGNTIAPAAYLSYPENVFLDNVALNDGPQNGVTYTFGDGVTPGFQGHLTEGSGATVYGFVSLYGACNGCSLYDDRPFIGIEINGTDSFFVNTTVVNANGYGIYAGPGAHNDFIINPHVWSTGGTSIPTSVGYYLAPGSWVKLTNPVCDGTGAQCVEVASNDDIIVGGTLGSAISASLLNGVHVDSGVTRGYITGFDARANVNTLNSITVASSDLPLPTALQIFNIPGMMSHDGILELGTHPGLNNGTCTGSSPKGGMLAGSFTAATCNAGTYIISSLPVALNGYTCEAHDQTNPTDLLNQTANGTGSATLTGTTVANDIITFKCSGW